MNTDKITDKIKVLKSGEPQLVAVSNWEPFLWLEWNYITKRDYELLSPITKGVIGESIILVAPNGWVNVTDQPAVNFDGGSLWGFSVGEALRLVGPYGKQLPYEITASGDVVFHVERQVRSAYYSYGV